MATVEDINALVIGMHKAGFVHIKRGFNLRDADAITCSNHVLEEVVELQAEVLHGNYRSQISEAADVLGALLHLLWLSGIPLDVVLDQLERSLANNFTLDPNQVTAVKPGYTRNARRPQ